MREFIKSNIKKLIIINGVVFIIMLVLNGFTPYIVDDFPMKMHIADEGNIFSVLWEHYLGANGRIVPHFFAYCFLSFPKFIFNIFNSLIYILTANYIYVLSMEKESSQYSICKILIIYSVMWFFLSAYGQTVLWLDGSCNYLWGTSVILLFILPYHIRTIWKNNIRPSAVIMFLLGTAAGNCSENTSGGCIILVAVYMIIVKLRKEKLPKWTLAGLVGCITGFAFIIAAPGNIVRISSEDNYKELTIINKLANRLTETISSAHTVLWFMGVIMVLLLAYCFFKNKRKAYLNKYILIGIYVFTALAVIIALILAPFTVERALFGASVFLIIALMYILDLAELRYINIAAYSLTALYMISFGVALSKNVQTYRFMTERDRYAVKQAESGADIIYIPVILRRDNLEKHNFLYKAFDATDDINFWCNQNFAQWYKTNYVKAFYIDNEDIKFCTENMELVINNYVNSFLSDYN